MHIRPCRASAKVTPSKPGEDIDGTTKSRFSITRSCDVVCDSDRCSDAGQLSSNETRVRSSAAARSRMNFSKRLTLPSRALICFLEAGLQDKIVSAVEISSREGHSMKAANGVWCRSYFDRTPLPKITHSAFALEHFEQGFLLSHLTFGT